MDAGVPLVQRASAWRGGDWLAAVPDLRGEESASVAGQRDATGRTLLHKAAGSQASVEVVALLLGADKGATSVRDEKGNTPLHLAAANKAPLEVVKMLQEACKDSTLMTDVKGNTPLHLAAANKAPFEVVKFLLWRRPSAAKKDKSEGYHTPLQLALMHDACFEVVQLLLEKGKDELEEEDYGELLLLAVDNRAALDVVQLLLAECKDVATIRDEDGSTPLHLAVANEASLERVQLLLRRFKKAVVLKNSQGDTPLMLAVESQAPPEVVQLLLEKHLEAAKLEDGEYARLLQTAAKSCAPLGVVQLLLGKCPAALTMQDKHGDTPLQLAVAHEAPLDVLQLLLKESSKAVRMEDGVFAKLLHVAIENEASLAVVQQLLHKCKEAAKIKDEEGNTPLHLAITHEARQEVVKLLLFSWPQAAQEMDNDKNLPLHLASENQSPPEVIDALLEAHSEAAITPSGKGVEPSTLLSSHNAFVSSLPGRIAAFTSEPAADSPQCHVWHAIVGIPQAAPDVRKAVAACEGLALGCKVKGRSAYEAAHAKCRDAMNEVLHRLGRYDFQRQAHRSATCMVELAVDRKRQGGPAAGEQLHDSQAVALKWMKGFKELQREVQMRLDLGLDNDFVVGMLRVHVDLNADDSQERTAELKDLKGRDGRHVEVDSLPFPSCVPEEYRFCLVMKQADVTLQDVLLHERIADRGLDKVRAASAELLCALHYLHTNGIVHGDLKPLNIMRLREAGKERWRLIDLDVACSSGHGMDSKLPSSGYCPPELAKKLLEAKRSGGKLAGCLTGYSATVAHDLWSFGVVLYQLCCAKPLWKLNHDDNLASDADLELLANWSIVQRDRLLREGGITKRGQAALWDLLTKLLDPSHKQRLEHWGPEPEEAVMAVSRHRFIDLDAHAQDNSMLDDVRDGIKSMECRMTLLHDISASVLFKIEDMSGNVALLLERMEAQSAMMKEMLKGVKEMPRLVVFLPVDGGLRKNWLPMLKDAVSSPGRMLEGVLSKTFRVHFVCALTLNVAGSGFEVKMAREWLVKAAPYLKVGLNILKIAAASGRVAGFPVPDVIPDGGVFDFLVDCSETIEAMCHTVDAAMEDSGIDNVAERGAQDGRVLEQSALELDRVLPEHWSRDSDKIGLCKAVCSSRGGDVEWCLPELVAEFEEKGPAASSGHYHEVLRLKRQLQALQASAFMPTPNQGATRLANGISGMLAQSQGGISMGSSHVASRVPGQQTGEVSSQPPPPSGTILTPGADARPQSQRTWPHSSGPAHQSDDQSQAQKVLVTPGGASKVLHWIRSLFSGRSAGAVAPADSHPLPPQQPSGGA